MQFPRLQVTLGGFDRLMPEDLLQHVERDARVGEPRRTRVAEPVTGQIRQTEALDERAPTWLPGGRRRS